MRLGSEMKNLSAELLASFKQRIKENEELVNEVQNTLDGFRKDHMDMAATLTTNAAALRKNLARGEKERLINEKERLHTHKDFMTGIHHAISSIQKEVAGFQISTINMMNEFTTERAEMAGDLNKFFAQGRAGRKQNEKTRMKDFDALMKTINGDITSINDEVSTILKNTNNMLERFEKEHLQMSDDLRADLGKNLAERVEYTGTLLNGFQKRLSEISNDNHKMAQKLRKDLAHGETERLNDYNGIMKGIHLAIKGIGTEVKNIKNSTEGMLDDLLQNRVQASAEWSKMQNTMAQIRKTGVASQVKEVTKKEAKKKAPVEAVKAVPVEAVKEIPIEVKKETPVKSEPVFTSLPEEPMTLEQKILNYLNKHPKGVKISEMEEPLGQTRMKLGYTAKVLLDEGKVLKIENIYYPVPKVRK